MPDLFAAAKFARAENLEGQPLRDFMRKAAGYPYHTKLELEAVLEGLPPQALRTPMDRSTAAFIEHLLSMRAMYSNKMGAANLPPLDLRLGSLTLNGPDRFDD